MGRFEHSLVNRCCSVGEGPNSGIQTRRPVPGVGWGARNTCKPDRGRIPSCF